MSANTLTGRIRLRACGIYIQQNAILLVKHSNLGPSGYFWSPPGGEVEYGETMAAAVEREFAEECNLVVKAVKWLYVTEYIRLPLHAVEHFYQVEYVAGSLKLGLDPGAENRKIQLTDLRWWQLDEMHEAGIENFHASLQKINDLQELYNFSFKTS